MFGDWWMILYSLLEANIVSFGVLHRTKYSPASLNFIFEILPLRTLCQPIIFWIFLFLLKAIIDLSSNTFFSSEFICKTPRCFVIDCSTAVFHDLNWQIWFVLEDPFELSRSSLFIVPTLFILIFQQTFLVASFFESIS